MPVDSILISIHVPRVEDDFVCFSQFCRYYISIHVPRVEDDLIFRRLLERKFHFNPRPPCGGRRYCLLSKSMLHLFQSTSPVWRTTAEEQKSFSAFAISIHVPRVEDDSGQSTFEQRRALFQSTSPVWRTTEAFAREYCIPRNFNPRPPCGGRRSGVRSATR